MRSSKNLEPALNETVVFKIRPKIATDGALMDKRVEPHLLLLNL